MSYEKSVRKDADNYPEFVATFARIGKALAPLLTHDTAGHRSAFQQVRYGNLANSVLVIRGLGKKDEYRLLR